jgi:hypothetical protein
VLSAGISVSAQDAASSATNLSVDFAPPDLSAFSILGLGPGKVARPGNVKELAIAVLNGNNLSEVASDIAVEWTPTATFGADDLDSYRKSRLLRNMQLSLATAGDSVGTRMAIGWRWVPIDRSDPALDKTLDKEIDSIMQLWNVDAAVQKRKVAFQNTASHALPPLLQQMEVENPDLNGLQLADVFNVDREDMVSRPASMVSEEMLHIVKDAALSLDIDFEQAPDSVQTALEDLCREYGVFMESLNDTLNLDKVVGERVIEAKERFKKRAWNATVVHVATGVVAQSPEGTWESLRLYSWNSYAGCALRIKSTGQLILQGRFEMRTRQESSIDYTYSGGMRVLLGGSDMRLNGEFAYEKAEGVCGCGSDEIWRYTVGGELKLTDELWLEMSIGKESVPGDSEDAEIISLANIKYGLSRKIVK